jgi:hypothetical protein
VGSVVPGLGDVDLVEQVELHRSHAPF